MPSAVTSKRLNLSVQYAALRDGLPERADIRRWVRAALDVDGARGGEIVIRFVEAEEGRALNREYRRKDYATNVLTFPYEPAPFPHPQPLSRGERGVIRGDLVICAPVVTREAAERRKPAEAHHAHLIVHGVLHLLGYDHETGEIEARRMEDLERALLASLGFADPYLAEREA